MAGKIQIKVGRVEFVGEGEETWVAAQLDKVLEKAQSLKAPEDDEEPTNGGGEPAKPASAGSAGTLASFLQKKNATSNQVARFLATAEWLTRRGASRLSTSDVTKALRDNHQAKLSNPADCLNKNVAKGFCEKDGKQFFVTPDGRANLG